jgi:hypothetical protein
MANYGTYGAISRKNKPKYGIFYTNLTASLYLSSSDMMNTIVVTNSNGNGIYLPDTSQIQGINRQIFIKNNNSTNIYLDIFDSLGNYLFSIAPYSQSVLWCADVSTTQGTWSYTTTKFNLTTGAISSTSSVGCHSTYGLSATSAIVFYYNGTNVFAYIVTINTTTLAITVGSPMICGSTATSFPSVEVINSTKLIMGANSGSGTSASILNISGTTITAYDYAVDTMVSATNILKLLTSTTAIILYRGTSGYTYGRILTFSGNTISVGAVYTVIGTSDPDYVDMVVANSTTAIISYRYTSGTTVSVSVLNISGNVISAVIQYNVATDNTNYFAPTVNICKLSPTKFILYYKRYNNTGNSFANLLTLSGSTISVGSQLVVYTGHISTEAANNASARRAISPLNSVSALIVFRGANDYIYMGRLISSGTELQVANISLIHNVSTSYYLSCCNLSPKLSATVYLASSGTSYVAAIAISSMNIV